MISISIIIPIYNVESFVAECLQSVAIQNYEGPIECILVDDCGADKSIEITKSFINKYQGDISFHLIHHNKNSGLSAARNTGINAAKGDYIYFLDSDDVITPDCISTLAKLAVGKEDMICGAFQTFEGYLNYWSDIYYLVDFSSYDSHDILKFYTQGHLYPMAVNKLIRRSFVTNNQLFFKEGILHEDELWSFMVANHSKSLKTTKHVTYKYRVREGSIITSNSKLKSHYSHVKILKEMDRLIKDNEIYSNHPENIYYLDKIKTTWAKWIIEDKDLHTTTKLKLILSILYSYRGYIFLKAIIKDWIKS